MNIYVHKARGTSLKIFKTSIPIKLYIKMDSIRVTVCIFRFFHSQFPTVLDYSNGNLKVWIPVNRWNT